MQWNDLSIVLAICRAGTLAGAARSLGLNHSTVFRRINGIEDKMGVRFFERLPHGYVMTEAGEVAMRAAERVDDEVLGLSRELLGRDLRLQGSIRVTAPEGISLYLIGPGINEFCKQHPDIRIHMAVTSSHLQLSRREADIAVRVTTTPPDSSLGRRVCRFRIARYATRNYLKKNPHGQLEAYDWLMSEEGYDWLTEALAEKGIRSPVNKVMVSNNVRVLIEAAKQDLGVIQLPCFLGDSEKKLVRLPDSPEEMMMELWLLTHEDLRNTARVRALMAFLHESLQPKIDLIEGRLPHN
jgi:DNA-binding transcriptional LysR family regulator